MADKTIIETPNFSLEWEEGHARFSDVYGAKCSLSPASSILPRIWLGVDHPSPETLSPELSEKDRALIDANHIRMCLSRRQALEIGKALIEWAEGETDTVITADDAGLS